MRNRLRPASQRRTEKGEAENREKEAAQRQAGRAEKRVLNQAPQAAQNPADRKGGNPVSGAALFIPDRPEPPRLHERGYRIVSRWRNSPSRSAKAGSGVSKSPKTAEPLPDIEA